MFFPRLNKVKEYRFFFLQCLTNANPIDEHVLQSLLCDCFYSVDTLLYICLLYVYSLTTRHYSIK